MDHNNMSVVILDLPPELLVHIFSFIADELTNLYNIEHTCEKFKNIIRHYEWNTIIDTNLKITNHVFANYKFNDVVAYTSMQNPLGWFCDAKRYLLIINNDNDHNLYKKFKSFYTGDKSVTTLYIHNFKNVSWSSLDDYWIDENDKIFTCDDASNSKISYQYHINADKLTLISYIEAHVKDFFDRHRVDNLVKKIASNYRPLNFNNHISSDELVKCINYVDSMLSNKKS